jgi:hypothetical protein
MLKIGITPQFFDKLHIDSKISSHTPKESLWAQYSEEILGLANTETKSEVADLVKTLAKLDPKNSGHHSFSPEEFCFSFIRLKELLGETKKDNESFFKTELTPNFGSFYLYSSDDKELLHTQFSLLENQSEALFRIADRELGAKAILSSEEILQLYDEAEEADITSKREKGVPSKMAQAERAATQIFHFIKIYFNPDNHTEIATLLLQICRYTVVIATVPAIRELDKFIEKTIEAGHSDIVRFSLCGNQTKLTVNFKNDTGRISPTLTLDFTFITRLDGSYTFNKFVELVQQRILTFDAGMTKSMLFSTFR